MRVAIIGVGHVGLVHGATLATIGHDVVGVDDDLGKIEQLQLGRTPFYEPGLDDLVQNAVSAGRLRFSADPTDAIVDSEVAFICVGTPGRPTGEPNLTAVERAAETVGRLATREMVVAEKSTVPVQTAERIRTVLQKASDHQFHVACNPEFLREGRAVEDSLRPMRVLVGANTPWGHAVMRRLYEPLLSADVSYFATDLRTAELAKHACNAFLALKISFANALARICEASEADVVDVVDIMGSDERIGRDFLDAGLGYGGSCFPKDIAAFRAQVSRIGYEFPLLDEIVKINHEAVEAIFKKIEHSLWNLEGKRVCLLGLAFKPGTDDVREAPALRLAQRLIDAGATVIGYDPKANANAVVQVPELQVADDLYTAAEGADCIVICTEWPEFAKLDLTRLKGILAHPTIVDGRNALDPQVMADAGFTYLPTGRPPVNS